jgi:hypothetical protein
MMRSLRKAVVFAGLGIGFSGHAVQIGKQIFNVAVPSAPVSTPMLLVLNDVVFPGSASAILRAHLTRSNATPIFLGSTTIVAVSSTARGPTRYVRLTIALSQNSVRRIHEYARRDTVVIDFTPVNAQRREMKSLRWSVRKVSLSLEPEK